jgi:hypothetical protein
VPHSLHPNKVKVKHNDMNLLIPALTICSLDRRFLYFKSGQELDPRKCVTKDQTGDIL